MEYMNREEDTRLAAMSTWREPETQGTQDRERNNNNEGLELLTVDIPLAF